MTASLQTHGGVVALLLVNLTVSSVTAQEPAAVDSGATNYAHRPNTVLKTDDDSLAVRTAGSGEIPVVLITGHMQDEGMYAGLIERHEAAAEYHVVIPPGMAGTPAYPWPDDDEAQRERLGRTIDVWRTVDEFTWHSNRFPAPFYSNDGVAGLRAVYEEAKSPMPVGVRYFAEYMVDDLTVIAEAGLMVWHDRPDAFDDVFLRALRGRTTEEDGPS